MASHAAAMKTLLAMCLLGWVSGLLAAEPPSDTRELVQAMRLDLFFEHVATDGATDVHKRGRITDEQLKCIQQYSPEEFTAPLADALAQYLGADELATALDYYRSPAGVRLVEATFVVIEAHRRGEAIEDQVKLSEPDQAALLAFIDTSAGRKLLDLKELVRAEPLEKVIYSKVMQAMQRCKPPARS